MRNMAVSEDRLVDSLIKASKNSDAKVRRDAIMRLGEVEDNVKAVRPLLERLFDSDASVRMVAARVFCNLSFKRKPTTMNTFRSPQTKVCVLNDL